MVTCDHYRYNAGCFAFMYRLLGFFTGRIYQAGKTNKMHFFFNGLGFYLAGYFMNFFTGEANYPHAIFGHFFFLFFYLSFDAVVLIYFGDQFCSSFCYHPEFSIPLMNGGHCFSVRIKRNFFHPFMILLFFSILHHRYFSWVTSKLSIFFFYIMIQAHSLQQLFPFIFILHPNLLHDHFVLR